MAVKPKRAQKGGMSQMNRIEEKLSHRPQRLRTVGVPPASDRSHVALPPVSVRVSPSKLLSSIFRSNILTIQRIHSHTFSIFMFSDLPRSNCPQKNQLGQFHSSVSAKSIMSYAKIRESIRKNIPD
jgi:hypothetical protein